MLDLNQAAGELDHLDPRVKQMAWNIVSREGGYSDDASDAGGPTNYGVSLRHARAQGMAFDINHDGEVDKDDIRLIQPEMAVVDFLMCFFVEPGLNKLPFAVQACAFDHAVNGGPAAAIRLVQHAVNSLGVVARLVEDGKLGPATLLAAMHAHDSVGDARMINALVDARVAEYQAIVARLPNNAKFLRGWLNRANAFRVKV